MRLKKSIVAVSLVAVFTLSSAQSVAAVTVFDYNETDCGYFGANEIWLGGTTQGYRNHRLYQSGFVALKELPYRSNLTYYSHDAGTEWAQNYGTSASAYGSINATYVDMFCA